MTIGVGGFDPQRLREALDLRGRTGKDVAKAIGVGEHSISRYIAGPTKPRPHTLIRLAKELALPEAYFLRPTHPLDGSPIFYRSMASATKRARNRARVRHRWLRESWLYIQQYVEFPDVEFPKFDLPTDPTELSMDTIEDVAQRTREEWGLDTGPIANLVKLLESHGGIVTRVKLGSPKLDGFSQWGEPENRPFITLNADKQAAVRSRWDAAHELGHMLLHRQVDQSLLHKPEVFKLAEQQAHRFAGAFLLPAVSFSRNVYVPAITVLLAQKRIWNVSIAAMLMRLKQLRLVDSEQATRVWQSYSRQGMRRREPLDDVIPPEQPEVLRRAFEMFMRERAISKEQLLAVLPFDDAELQAILCLPLEFHRHTGLKIEMRGAPKGESQGKRPVEGESRVIPMPTHRGKLN